MAPVMDVSRDALLGRRQAILTSIGFDEIELRKRDATTTLSEDELDAKEELDAIAFLLGEDDTGE
ncbi:hypothetical protein [Protaetiibacter mangrovi]|uniref:Uncharacterized protein n=1 Tax=Protaetiibacter mangrovi TaxID=2970926 RepID=A0ABT1ZD07_9MICO|nr:hypothetical protein [Protaetiibacter mangrovi]MCS0498581.1 hypothetical protein [Protaetiibacter mangrovi]TPX03760.1 hypothetical protein FJ656_15440 [Schumannella luteola]